MEKEKKNATIKGNNQDDFTIPPEKVAKMGDSETLCNRAEKFLVYASKKVTRDPAMCQIVTGLVYSVLAVANAIKEQPLSALTELAEENKRLREIANKALDDKSRLLDERMEKLNEN